MNLDFLHTKDKESCKTNCFLSAFIQEIKKSLNKNKIFVIDRFEGNMAVCEDQDNGEMANISKELLPTKVIEGMTIKFENNEYLIDYENCIVTRKNIIDELKNSWKKEEGAEYYIVTSKLEKAVKCSNIFIKQNIYIKDEAFIKTLKKGDIIKCIDDKYILDDEKNEELNNIIYKR